MRLVSEPLGELHLPRCAGAHSAGDFDQKGVDATDRGEANMNGGTVPLCCGLAVRAISLTSLRSEALFSTLNLGQEDRRAFPHAS